MPVIEGGTGNITLTNFGVLVGAATAAITQLAAASTGTVLTGVTGANPAFSATPSVTSITIANAPVAGTDGANKAYVDAIASGISYQNAGVAATTANLSATYANGAAGVGATLTNNAAMVAFSTDGISPILNDRVLVKNQTSTFENGIYTLTTVGSGAVNWVLTRATDYDQAPTEIKPGNVIPISSGTVNGGTSWLQTATVTTIGTDPILFVLFTFNSAAFAQNFMTDSGTAAVSGGGITFTGAQGITTSGAGATVTITLTNPVTIARGGTNATSFATTNGTVIYDGTRLVTLASAGTSGQPLLSTGAGTPPAYGTLTVPGGGTGATTLTGILTGNGAAAFTASAVAQYTTLVAGASNLVVGVAPSATVGIPYVSAGAAVNPAFGTAVVAGGGTGNTTFTAYSLIAAGTTATGPFQNVVGVGTSGQVLVSAGAGALPAWTSIAPGGVVSVTAGTGINLTGTAANPVINMNVPVVIANGGTNATSFAVSSGTVIFDGTRLVTLASTGTSGQALVSAGAGVAPAYGILPIIGGGTNASSFGTVDGTIIYDGTRLVATATGTAGQVLTSNGAGVAPTYQASGASGVSSITGNSGGAISGAISLVTANATVKFVGSGSTITQDFNLTNLSLGSSLPSLTSGTRNVAMGSGAFASVTSSASNVCIGYNAGTAIQTGAWCVFIGDSAGANTAVSGSASDSKIGIGYQALSDAPGVGGIVGIGYQACKFSPSINIGIGDHALASNTTDTLNIAIGWSALTVLNGAGAGNNVAIGHLTGGSMTTGSGNQLFGNGAGGSITTGTNNTFLGAGGGNITTTSNNIMIGNVSGTAGDANTLRIASSTGTGTGGLNRAFIQGIRGITTDAADGIPVFVSSTGQLGTGGGATIVNSVAGNSGGALSGALSLVTANSTVKFAGSGTTITQDFNLSNLAMGSSMTAITTGVRNVGVGSTTLAALTTGQSNVCVGYNTGNAMTAGFYNVYVGDSAGSTSVGGLGGAVSHIGIGYQALSGAAGNSILGIGYQTLKSANGDFNIGIGDGIMPNTTGTLNTGMGWQALSACTSGSGNTCIGVQNGVAVTTGAYNTIIGTTSAGSLTTGSRNTILGGAAGTASLVASSDNIYIGYGSGGSIAESNKLRIGVSTGTGTGQLDKSFIHGIRGVTTDAADAIAVLISSTGQLGTVSSSARVKENIVDMDSYSDVLMQLRPVVFNYKQHSPESKSVGLIAEEVAPIAPRLVVYDQEGLPETVKYHELVPMLLNEIQKLSNRVKQLEQEFRGK